MDRGAISRPTRRSKGRKPKRAPGLAVVERDGFWHIHGTVVAQGRSIRVRTSTRLPSRSDLWEEADNERLRIEAELRAEAQGKVGRGPHLSVAAEKYLTRKRKRPLGKTSIGYVKRAVRKFGLRYVGDIPEKEWVAWVDKQCRSVKSETRERFINTISAFLAWCAAKPRRWGTPPTFDRDKEARNPRRRARRRVHELSMPLIELLISQAAPHIKPQIWTEWTSGARVSSILRGCMLSDLVLAEGREQLTFRDTKNGETVTSMLHPRAVEAIKEYLKIRGRLHDREGPLFLTHRGKPYSKDSDGVQNKTAFNAMKRRARTVLRKGGFAEARRLKREGDLERMAAVVDQTRADHRLLGQVTQHWFRHMLATGMRGDIRAAMDQGGWLDERSVLGYMIDQPDHRRAIVNQLDSFFRRETLPGGR